MPRLLVGKQHALLISHAPFARGKAFVFLGAGFDGKGVILK
jgi:hypothetical protein